MATLIRELKWIKRCDGAVIAELNGHFCKVLPKIKRDPWARGTIDGKLYVSKKTVPEAQKALEKQFFKMGFDYT